MNKHLETIIALLVEQTAAASDHWDADSNLVEDCGLDSLDLSELALALEENFDVVVPDETIEGWKTLGDICRFLEQNDPNESDYGKGEE